MSENTATKTVSAPAIAVSQEAVDAIASLVPNSVGQASIDFYRAVATKAGIDFDSLSSDEVVEVTRRLYSHSADFRRTRADVAKAEREAVAAAAKAKRDAEKKARLVAKREALAKALAAIESE